MSPLSPALALGPLRLTVADLAGTAAFYERVIGLRRLGADDDDGVRLGAGSAGHPRARRARRRRCRPAASTRIERPLPPGAARAGPALARRGAAARGRGGLAPRRRLRPPRQRGALPVGPGGQRDRALPRPTARGVATRRERRAGDGDAAARPRRPARRARRRRRGGWGSARRARAARRRTGG